jgi:hypothetical protein
LQIKSATDFGSAILAVALWTAIHGGYLAKMWSFFIHDDLFDRGILTFGDGAHCGRAVIYSFGTVHGSVLLIGKKPPVSVPAAGLSSIFGQ